MVGVSDQNTITQTQNGQPTVSRSPFGVLNFIDETSPSQKAQIAYAFQAAQHAARRNTPLSPDTMLRTTPETNPTDITYKNNEPPSVNKDIQAQRRAFNREIQHTKVAQGEALTAESAVDAVAANTISEYTDAMWLTWMWGSIPAIFVDFGLNFTLATMASWVSLLKTWQGPMLEKMLKKSVVSAMPPAFSFLPGIGASSTKGVSGLLQMIKIGAGLNAFGFFIAAHMIWVLLGVLLAGVIVAVYFIAAPYIEVTSTVCHYFNVHPLCLSAP